MASHVMRAWNGKLKNIDTLLIWMYNKDILNKGEKAKKDSIFYRYYRYYNDGDKPRGMKWELKEKIEEYIEVGAEDFSRKMLKKYAGKYSRKQFRIDTHNENTKYLIELCSRNEFHSLTKYWKKDVKDVKILKMISLLETKYDETKLLLNTELDKQNLSQCKCKTMEYAFEELRKKIMLLPMDLVLEFDNMKSLLKIIRVCLENTLVER